MERLNLEYYYGKEAEQFTFYRLPKALITDNRFKYISNNAKLLYGLMLDRMSLSRKRGWLDAENRVYIKYSIQTIADDINVAKNTGVALLKELQDVGLIDLVQQNGKANVIYVKNFISGADEVEEPLDQSNIHTGGENGPAQELNQSNNCTGAENEPVRNMSQFKNSTGTESEMVLGEKSIISSPSGAYEASQKMDRYKFSEDTSARFDTVPSQFLDTSNILTNNNMSNTNPIHLSVLPSNAGKIDAMDEVQAYMELIKENIDYDIMMSRKQWHERDMYDELYNIICDVVCVPRTTIRIGGEDYPYQLVKSKFLKLNSSHLEYVITCMQNNTTKVNNIKAYLITALYNAPNTIDHFYTAEVMHDMYGVG